MSGEKHGIVYLADPEGWPGEHRYEGNWEGGDPMRVIENGPGWDDPDDAAQLQTRSGV